MSKLISFSDFASLAGIKSNALSVYVTRQKVVIAQTIGFGKEKQVLIDPESLVNKTFLKERELIKARKAYESTEKTDNTPDNKSNTENKPNLQNSNTYFELTKKAEYEFKKSRAEMAKIDLEQRQGKLIPTEKVKTVTADFVQQYKANFMNQTELLIRDLCNENSLSNEIRTRACSALTDIANEATHIAIESIKKSVLKIVDEQKNLNL
jgi:hypothetical protein